MLTGPDVSHWQKVVDWPSVARQGHAFAWCKATEEVGFVDDFFARNYPGIRDTGMVRGAYHFLRREWSAADQAEHYVRTVQAHGGFGGALSAVDVETKRFTAKPGHPTPPPT
ncbi:MAG TPA: GH25 family lysozyme, partial [Acidimicrobiales bacterium]